MDHPRRLPCVCVGVILFSALSLLFSIDSLATTPENKATAGNAGQPASDEARWKNGELLAPLPADPVKRAEAIRLAKEAGHAHALSSGLAPAAGVRMTRGVIQPQKFDGPRSAGVSQGTSRRPAPPFSTPLQPPFEPFVPTAEQLREAEQIPGIVIDPSEAPAVPGLMGSFEAVDYTGWTPPSPDIAVGPAQVLVATTDVFAVYDKCGNWIDGGDFGDYFGVSTAYTLYDPRVVYDDWSGRWVMAYIANDFTGHQSRIIMVISEGANLEDGWSCIIHAPITSPGDYLDNMYLAVDPEGIYFTFNQFNFSTYVFDGAVIAAFEKEGFYACGAGAFLSYVGLTNPGDASQAFAIRPAQMRSYPGAMYFLDSKYQGGTLFTLWSLTDPFGSPSLNSSSITTTAYTLPPTGRQPNGTYVKTGDCRIGDLAYFDGNLNAVFAERTSYSGTDYARLDVREFGTSPVSAKTLVWMTLTQNFMCYPSLDIDENGRLAIVYAYCSDAMSAYLSMRWQIWDWNSGTIDGGVLAAGLANFTLGGSGTAGNPYRWGNFTGCATDPVDDRTFWVCGPYASNDPTPSWSTRVGAVSASAASNLAIEPAVSLTGGLVGGPFVKEVLPVTLSNDGQTDAHWRITSYPDWLTPSTVEGQIPPANSQVISFFLNEEARDLPSGTYNEPVVFNNCTGAVSGSCTVSLAIVEPIACATTAISLAPPVGDAIAVYGTGTEEYSVFITAMEDIDVCAIGLMLAHAEPLPITCKVYEANGNTRGSLLYANSEAAVQDADGTYLVPMDVTLGGCQDYEVVFTHPSSIGHASYNEADFSYPFDANGVIRVRQSATNGSVGDPKHPGIVVFGRAACDLATAQTTDLFHKGTTHTETSTNTTQGLFITARENMRLCSVGFEADLVRDRWLVAQIFKATGNVRGAPVAQGFTPVQTGGLAMHEIPIHAILEAGQDYNVSVDTSEKGYWPALAEGGITLPYTVDNNVEVRKGEFNGAAAANLPHLWLNWEGMAVRGAIFDLAKSSGGYSGTSSGIIDHGAFVRPAVTQEVYSLGVFADIPEGTTIVARIYRLTMTGERGPLQTEGSIASGGSGLRWHDVPVALRWSGGNRYDLSIVCSNTTECPYWLDTTGLPYTAYGTIQVQDGEREGDPKATDLIHLRITACDEALTGIGDNPPRFSTLLLEPPVPNPANGLVRFRYTVDAPGAADLEIYDVAGRRVASVFAGRQVSAGPGEAQFDTAGLPSGVYFLKLTAGDKAVSRKIVVMR
jgi:hypothetical protein